MANDALSQSAPGSESESDEERIARELEELLHELRTVIPGAQVLFAFLLTVAFTQRFEDLSSTDRDIYFGVFVISALALILLLAPTAFHRVRFRQRDKEAMLRIANRELITAMVLTSFAIAGSVYLVGRIAIDLSVAVAAAIAVWVFSLVVWWFVPLLRRGQEVRPSAGGVPVPAMKEEDAPCITTQFQTTSAAPGGDGAPQRSQDYSDSQPLR